MIIKGKGRKKESELLWKKKKGHGRKLKQTWTCGWKRSSMHFRKQYKSFPWEG